MKIGIMGSGEVGVSLATGLARHGHAVLIASRTPAKLTQMRDAKAGIEIGDFQAAARFGDIVILAVKGPGVSQALSLAGADLLRGKIVIDATNPIADVPPVNGVLTLTTSINRSAMEALQTQYPAVRFVKAFNSVGADLMIDPELSGGPPTMFICGNDANAKAEVTALLESIGWEAADMGAVEAARAIEPLSVLWCIPGFLRNEWIHAFKLLRA
jgi:8-hydroxy-5-deazaflavin:NADPH oxidoreductase